MMKRTYIVLFEFVFLIVVLSVTTAVLTANEPDHEAHRLALIYEETGQIASHTPIAVNCTFSQAYQLYLCPEPKPTHIEARDPLAAQQAKQLLHTIGLLLVADSTDDRIMAFHPITGDLVDPNFIPTDLVNLDFPYQALKSAAGNSILVSDFNMDLIQEYDLDGNYIGPFAPTNGVSTTILEAPRGMALRPNGNLLVTVGAGPNIDSVVEFDPQGNYLGTFIAPGSGGLDTAHDIYGRSSDWLVSKSDPGSYDGLLRYDLMGNHLGDFTQVDGTPQQIAGSHFTSTVLVANFSLNQRGVLEFTEDGNFVGQYNPLNINPRGVYELPNGRLLVTMGTSPGTSGVYEIDRQAGLIDTKITGGTPRYIEYIFPAALAFTKTVGLEPDVCTTVNELDVAAGTAVTYCYHITNTSLITYNLHTLQDSHLGTILFNVPYTLTPGTSFVVTETAVLTQSTINTATWTASDSVAFTTTATAAATVNAFPLSLTLTTTLGIDGCTPTDVLTVTLGTEVTTCYEVTNTGQFTLTSHDVEDSQSGTILTGFAFELAPGASTLVTRTMVVSATAVHTTTWTAYASTGPTATAVDTFTINIIPATKQFQLFLPFITAAHNP